jgi:hypothetical protein
VAISSLLIGSVICKETRCPDTPLLSMSPYNLSSGGFISPYPVNTSVLYEGDGQLGMGGMTFSGKKYLGDGVLIIYFYFVGICIIFFVTRK